MLKRFTAVVALAAMVASCSSMPEPKVKWYDFPKEAYIEKPDRPHEVVGIVRTKVEFPTLLAEYDESALCRNYFNKAARDLLKRAEKLGADAVIELRSVVFLVDGRREVHSTPECADDGQEGQVLAEARAVKWKAPVETPEPTSKAPSEKEQKLSPADPRRRFR